jgi:cytochrome oxidase Cu insertion factor (SCO1/SenC/PrrC family)
MRLQAACLMIFAVRASGWRAEPITFPDAILADQTGKAVHFYTDLIKGKIVVLDFIFTSCTIVCQPLTANLRKVQVQLGDEAAYVQFVSVSVDPDRDTPAALEAFAQRFHAPPAWKFLTGAKPDIDRILRACGVYTVQPNFHTAGVLIGGDSGGWSRLYGLSSPAILAQAIRHAIHPDKKEQSYD